MKKFNTLKSIWLGWLVLALLTASSLLFMDVAIHAPELPTPLSEGKQLTWRVWRPFATSNTQFEMGYHRAADGDLRLNVLGDKQRGIVGEPVVMNFTVNGTSCSLQQDDVIGWNDWVFRPLKPVQAGCMLPEQAGWNEWTADIVQVSPKLAQESVRLGTLSPAGSMKQRADNRYGMMAELLFWGELIWLPFFLFMSIPLAIDALNRLFDRLHVEHKWRQFWQRLTRKHTRNKR